MMNYQISFFTIVARNYLAQAYTLGDSVKTYHPDCSFYIFLMDDVEHSYGAEINQRGFSVVAPDQIGIKEYKQFVFKYNIVEACTGVKPFVMQHLLDKGADKVFYLDPDILCFRRLDEAIEALDTYSIVITPHSLSPMSGDYGYPDDRIFLKYGVYNLGFIGVAKGKITQAFLAWWGKHLLSSCLMKIDVSLFVDQKWIDLVPSYFDKVFILKNLGYNIAPWNIDERTLSKVNGTFYVVESGVPVAFIHYSSIDINDVGGISKHFRSAKLQGKKTYSLSNRPDLVEAYQDYAKLLIQNQYVSYSSIPYAFSKYNNGESISQKERTLFFESPEWQLSEIDPFQVGENSFCKFCRQMGIEPENLYNPSYTTMPPTGNQPRNMAFIAKSIIKLLMRAIIIILGLGLYNKIVASVTNQLVSAERDYLMEKKNLYRERGVIK